MIVNKIYKKKIKKVLYKKFLAIYNDFTNSWGFSSAGRAPALHAGGQEFESPNLHHKKPNDICYSVFYFVWVGFDEKLPMYEVHLKGVARVS